MRNREMTAKELTIESWSQKYKSSINCSHPKGFSQKAHCAGKKKHNESIEMEMTCEDCGMCETHGDHSRDTLDEACWKDYHKDGMKKMFGKQYPNCIKNKNESLETYIRKGECPGCGETMVAESQLNEKQDACYHKVKARYKVWPSAYASGALVKCRKKGASNWGNSNESITQEEYDNLDENLHDWFGKEKWVRMDTKGNIKGPCARGSESEGKPKCLPQSKAHSLGKKGRASAAARKRREDPNPDRSGKAINVSTSKKSNEGMTEASSAAQQAAIAIAIKKRKGMSENYTAEDEQLDGMSLGELKAIAQAAKKIYNSVKSGTPLEAWMYKMITNSNEGLTSVAQQIGNPEISEAEWVSEGERTMSRAAKGNEKYGKDGMKQLAKAGRDGASEKKLDSIRDKYDKYDDEDTEEDVTESNLYRILELSGLVNEEAELQFDKIEEWVESLAEAHGVDSEVIWEDFETVSDSELLSETAAWQKSAGKNKTGGLNQKGVDSYRSEHPGSKLQTAVTTKPSKLKKGSKAAKRRKSFCARMSGMKGPMKKPNGKPTRKALSLRKWNC
jgi:hypothetical protein